MNDCYGLGMGTDGEFTNEKWFIALRQNFSGAELRCGLLIWSFTKNSPVGLQTVQNLG